MYLSEKDVERIIQRTKQYRKERNTERKAIRRIKRLFFKAAVVDTEQEYTQMLPKVLERN